MTRIVQSGTEKRRSVHPNEVVRYLCSLRALWWVAGGWALDLFVGSQSRPHKDLDIGVMRRDALEVLAALSSWEIFEAKDGWLTRLREGDAEVNLLWCRPAGDMEWTFELMLDESHHVAPRLDTAARAWLRGALTRVDPRHKWLISSRSCGPLALRFAVRHAKMASLPGDGAPQLLRRPPDARVPSRPLYARLDQATGTGPRVRISRERPA